MDLSKLSKPGDDCQTCRKQWTHQKLPPKQLQAILDADGNPITTDKGIPVVACSFCDGELIFALSKLVINNEAESEAAPETDVDTKEESEE